MYLIRLLSATRRSIHPLITVEEFQDHHFRQNGSSVRIKDGDSFFNRLLINYPYNTVVCLSVCLSVYVFLSVCSCVAHSHNIMALLSFSILPSHYFITSSKLAYSTYLYTGLFLK